MHSEGFLRKLLASVLFATFFSYLGQTHSSDVEDKDTYSRNAPKLLIILMDGFRWDYFDRQKLQLPGLSQLVSGGVQVEYVEPIFPSLSFPSWTTIATGLYPENHNILGNYMLHLVDSEFPEETLFQLKDNSTLLPWWWSFAEPIWTTATKNNLQVFMANWARCDVPIDGLLPTECTGYTYQDINSRFRDDLTTAVKRLKDGFSLAMVYDDLVDHAGHRYGPDSNELRFALTHRDSQIQELLMNLQRNGLNNKVNVVIISDHGMSGAKSDKVNYVQLSDYLQEDNVHKVIDYGALCMIAAAESGNKDMLYNQLLMIPGVDVYKKEDIPEDFHFKRSKLVHDFLLVAKPGFVIVGLKGTKQIPNDGKSSSVEPYSGIHGYHNSSEMNTIFFAKGPAFKKGLIHPPIRLEDEYQVFMHVLKLTPRPHNGTWASVEQMLAA